MSQIGRVGNIFATPALVRCSLKIQHFESQPLNESWRTQPHHPKHEQHNAKDGLHECVGSFVGHAPTHPRRRRPPPTGSSNSSASFSITVPPNCSASTMVTARR